SWERARDEDREEGAWYGRACPDRARVPGGLRPTDPARAAGRDAVDGGSPASPGRGVDQRGHGFGGGPVRRPTAAPALAPGRIARRREGDLRVGPGGAGRPRPRGPERAGEDRARRDRDARSAGRLLAGVRGAARRGRRGARPVDVVDLDLAPGRRRAGGRGAADVARCVRTRGGESMRIAILGATGAVGQTILRVLEERGVEADEIVPLASERSRGSRIDWRGRSWEVRAPEPGVFR